jgi:hypothetical protein
LEHGIKVRLCTASAGATADVTLAGTADVVNLALVLGFDAAVLHFMGFKSLMYLLLGVVLGGGLHPIAGHLIAEHYMFLKVRVRSCFPAETRWLFMSLLTPPPRRLAVGSLEGH